MTPKVSIILPNYNGEKYLKKTIQSVLNQTFTDYEFIIVDDASTDNSRQIIEQFEDKRIIRYYSEVNRHVAYTTNIGFAAARGEYIARIDSDDQWESEKLEKQVKFLDENTKYGACFTKVNIIDDDSCIANDKYQEIEKLFNNAKNQSQREWLKYFIFTGNCLCNPSVVMRREAMDKIGRKYNIAYVPAQDFELWTRMVLKYPIYIMDERLVKYRWTELENKISGNQKGKEYAFRNVHMLIRKKLIERMTEEEWNLFLGDNDEKDLEKATLQVQYEKALLLLRNVDNEVNFLGLDKFEEILNDSEMLMYMEKKGFSLREYYKEYRVRNFGISEEISKKDRRILELSNKDKENRDRITQLDAELNRMRDEIHNMRESTSWKITRPFRKVGRIILKTK